jgi:N-acyl homoserine lactone hydrolase
MVPMPWDWSTSAMSMTRMHMKQLERTGIPLFFCHDAGVSQSCRRAVNSGIKL